MSDDETSVPIYYPEVNNGDVTIKSVSINSRTPSPGTAFTFDEKTPLSNGKDTLRFDRTPSATSNEIKIPRFDRTRTPSPIPINGILAGSRLDTTQDSSDVVDEPSFALEFKSLSYFIHMNRLKCWKREQKQLLHSVSGCFKTGELVAIMGPSGAGKSTLLNVLSGYLFRNVEGTITVNDRPRNLRLFRKMSCYIMQDDYLLDNLTVWESMMAAANLKLPSKTKAEEKVQIVTKTLEALNLLEQRKTRACKLSGGQRKRLSIALELVNNPPIMFFDEPTSGLDSQSSVQCIALLKSLAASGRAIICTIHQPSARVFEIFDKLYLLADGQCAYNGNTASLIPFLRDLGLQCPAYHNPADFVIEAVCGEYGPFAARMVEGVNEGKCQTAEKLPPSAPVSPRTALSQAEERLKQSLRELNDMHRDSHHLVNVDKKLAEQLEIDVEAPMVEVVDRPNSPDVKHPAYATSQWTQFWVLFCRTFKCILRDSNLTRLRFVSHIVVGLMIGSMYYKIGNKATRAIHNTASLFVTCLFLLFTAMMPTLMTFPLETNVLKREHLNSWYGLKAYYIAKTMADTPFQVVFPIVYGSIYYFMTEQPNDAARFAIFLGVMVATSLVAQSLGLLIGAAFDLQTAIFLGPITAIPIVLFSGFFLRISDIPPYFRWMSYMSYIRYTFKASLVALYGMNRTRLECDDDADANETCGAVCPFQKPQAILDQMDINSEDYWNDLLVLGAFFVFFRTVAFIVLRLKMRLQR